MGTILKFRDANGIVVEYPVITTINEDEDWRDRYNDVAPAGYEISVFDTFGDRMFEILDEVSANYSVGVSFWNQMTDAQFNSNLNAVINAL